MVAAATSAMVWPDSELNVTMVPGRARRAGRGHIPGRVHHAGEPDGAEQERHRHLGAQHGRGEIRGGGARAGGHPGSELNLLEGVDVGPEGPLGARTPLEVVPHRTRQPAPGEAPGVGHGADTSRRPPLAYSHLRADLRNDTERTVERGVPGRPWCRPQAGSLRYSRKTFATAAAW